MNPSTFRLTALSGAIIAIILASSLFYLDARSKVFPLDDAYIHSVYARNLAQGYGLCFNAGELSFGTSSPLWVLLLSICMRLGFDSYYATVSLSLCCYAVTALLIFFVCRSVLVRISGQSKTSVARAELFSLAACLLYILSGNMLWHALSGMETPLYHLLSMGLLYAYVRTGYSILTAVISGLLLLCRITGLSLVIPLLAVDVLKNKKIFPTAILTLLIATPYYLYSKAISGSFFPVTAQGKLLTYVDGGFDCIKIGSFIINIIKYLFLYEPAFFLLGIITLIFSIVAIAKNRQFDTAVIPLVIIWTAVDLSLHILFFRSLNHHLRYLAVIFAALPLSGIFFLFCLSTARNTFTRNSAYIMLSCIMLLCMMRQPFWMNIYQKNIQHVKQVYFPCAEWVKNNTPAAPLAAFDIGILKFVTSYPVVDLGGVTTRQVHPYLQYHTAGRYIHDKHVKFIVYSRFPDCDVWSGIYRSEYDRSGLLQERFIKTFSTAYYPEPSITHSFQLDVVSVDKWIEATPEGCKEKFYAVDAFAATPVGKKITGELELSGYTLEKSSLPVVWKMAQSLSLTYYWKNQGTINRLPIVNTRLVNADSGEVIINNNHIPTHDLLEISWWGLGHSIKERHVLWIPDNAPVGRYQLWVSLAENASPLQFERSLSTFKTALHEIAGMPLRDFPISKRPERGVMIGTFTIEPSTLQLLY